MLLAVLVLAGGLALPHSHGPASGHAEHSPRTAFPGGHSEPDGSRHIEAATRIDSSSCLACLYRQPQRGVTPYGAPSGALEPDRSASLAAFDRSGPTGSTRLPATRAPPLA